MRPTKIYQAKKLPRRRPGHSPLRIWNKSSSVFERTLGGWNAILLARINFDSAAQHARQSLEAGFGDVMAIVAVERLHMQGHASVHGESLEPFAHQFRVELADLGTGEFYLPDQIGAARHIDGGAGERLIHGQETIGVTADALAIAQRLGKGLAQGNA